jgi:hypothetical protein
MNKYLEKLALNPIEKGILVGGGIGAVLGAGLGYSRKTDEWRDQTHTYTKKERIGNAITDGIGLGIAGAFQGIRYGLKKSFTGPRGGNNPFSSTHRPLSQHFKDMGAPTGFKTKAEAHRYFKSMASKYHPDKATGNAKKMQEINAAWTKAKAHPDFIKMAGLNKYVRILNDNF